MSRCKNEFNKRDYTKKGLASIKERKHSSHLTIRFFHWAQRPMLWIHYWEKQTGEMRYCKVSAHNLWKLVIKERLRGLR